MANTFLLLRDWRFPVTYLTHNGNESDYPSWTYTDISQRTDSVYGYGPILAFQLSTARLISPVVDASSAKNLTLKYVHGRWGYTSAPTALTIDVMTGGTWDEVATNTCGGSGQDPPPQLKTVDLSAYDGSPSLQIRFRPTGGPASIKYGEMCGDLTLTG